MAMLDLSEFATAAKINNALMSAGYTKESASIAGDILPPSMPACTTQHSCRLMQPCMHALVHACMRPASEVA
jgi:hypothetical protein